MVRKVNRAWLRGMGRIGMGAAALLCVAGLAGGCLMPAPALSEDPKEEVSLKFDPGTPTCKSADPDEELISDLNIFIFRTGGALETWKYCHAGEFPMEGREAAISLRLLKNVEYDIYACANLGYPLGRIRTREELMEERFHMAYPDEYSHGMAMSGKAEGLLIGDEAEITVPLRRCMAKISLSIDRRMLRDKVKFNVHGVSIGNCPRSVGLFSRSRARAAQDCFASGFVKELADADALNMDRVPGLSGELSVYMLENMQGTLLPEATRDAEKVPEAIGAHAQACSYIEIRAEYSSDSLYSLPGEYLCYRFYLGEGPGNFDIRRGCHYHIRVQPRGHGLSEDSWRVDRSALVQYRQATISLSPGKYIEGRIGEDVHVRAEVKPEGVPLRLDPELLQEDLDRGIYEYEMDSDGYGLTLHLLKPGMGILYFEAGNPVTAEEMAVVIVTP